MTLTTPQIFTLYQDGDFNAAVQAASDRLNDNPEDAEALFIVGQIYLKSQRHGLAYNIYERLVQMQPANANAWNNAGHAMHGMNRFADASKLFVEALKAGGDRYAPYNNLMLMFQNMGDVERSKYLYRLAVWLADNDQDRRECTGNVSLSLLATRQWETGWDAYEHLIRPDKLREEIKYEPDLPRWDGSPDREILVYGEQGIGDEILFASCIPDAQRTNPVVLDCDPRLAGLFRRSFGCTTHGTRFNKTKPWVTKAKAKCAIGSLARFYRRDEASFPRQPYLKPDPEKRAMARALLDQWPGRKIGLAWTGGRKYTRTEDRSLTIDRLDPILSIPDCTFVSLQYAGDYYETPDQRIKHVPIFTRSNDYGDTAALVAELDAVVSVTTAVAFLAGAMGRPVHVLVPEFPTWHWPRHGEFPWFPLHLYRRSGGDWAPVVQEVAGALQ